MKRLQLTHFAFAIVCGTLALFTSGCPGEVPKGGAASKGLKRIVILTNGDDPYWDACEAGAMKAQDELKLKEQGYEVSFARADFTDKGQIDKIKQYAMQSDLVGIGISIVNPESAAVAKELRDMQKKGIKVITIDGDISRENFRDARYAYLGTDNIVAGRELGKAAKSVRPEGAKVAIFSGKSGAANVIQRSAGFLEGAGEGFVEVERLEDGGDRAQARRTVKDSLDRNPQIDALVGVWAYNPPAIVAVLKELSLEGQKQVFAFDAAEQSIAATKEGKIDAMIVQNPYQMGFTGVELLKALVEDNQEFVKKMYPNYSQDGKNDMFDTELRMIIPQKNADKIDKSQFDSNTSVMTIDEFEAWLKERNLRNS
ncbi:substrate-binding domain-containing protein [Planctomicrobium sp. SH668]|uniref:substrate-binding domain-containing protein n=1 Tax=Planctomicrobium sp. SH668 TaxID=3448126 RepID=UPI003F5B7B2E